MPDLSGVVFDKTSADLSQAVIEASERHAVHAYNIANASTPGFKPLKFDEMLKKAVERNDKEEFNIEEEMAAMSNSRLEHSALVKILSAKIQIMKKIVTMGKG